MNNGDLSLTRPGNFILGANYWASHAGTGMWADWQPDVVERDLMRLAQAGLHVLRVFPLWPDFQPLTVLRAGQGKPVEYRHGEEPLADDDAGRAGVSALAIQHFADFADMAHKYNLRLIVGLITGWMSGRLFTPPAFDGLNVLADPAAVMWQTRFVSYFVRRFRTHAAIAAWDLGNECNCTAAATRDQAWVWTSAIVNAIHAADPDRPVVSGMHSLPADPHQPWSIHDQGELTDVLTTHPYPVFTPHCDQDPLNTIRTLLHATAESRFYADIGNKPCLCEEIGTLGSMIASEEIARDFLRSSLFSLWANDCHGLLWWCASDQHHLRNAPYDWQAVERELGLFRVDGSAKPVAAALSDFRRFLDTLPFVTLPPHRADAVCILSDGQDQWGVAYSTYILAKQAGVDIAFQYESQPLRDAALYLMPCISGHKAISRRRWLDLLERVKAGATLYMSHNDGFLSGFEEVTGLEVQTRQRRAAPAQVTMSGITGQPRLSTAGPIRLALKPTRATVLGAEADGNPAFTCAAYGKGRVYFLSFAMEQELSNNAGAFHSQTAQPFWHIYRHLFSTLATLRVVAKHSPFIGMTEHDLSAQQRAIVAINYSPQPLQDTFMLADGWHVGQTLHGAPPSAGAAAVSCTIAANDALVFAVQHV